MSVPMDGRMNGLSGRRSSSKEKDEAPGVPPQVFEPRDTRALFCPLRRTNRPLGLVSLHPPTQLSLGYPPSSIPDPT